MDATHRRQEINHTTHYHLLCFWVLAGFSFPPDFHCKFGFPHSTKLPKENRSADYKVIRKYLLEQTVAFVEK